MLDIVVTLTEKHRNDDLWKALFNAPAKEEWVNTSLLHMGYPDLTKINRDIFFKTQKLAVDVDKQAEPCFLLKSEPFLEISKAGFHSRSMTVRSHHWASVASLMETPAEVCCFGMTLGNEIENTISSLSNQSVMEGFIWDALCSTLAEHYVDQVESCLKDYYSKQNLKITRRFSPGYCDVPFLETQKAIFKFCDMNEIGIQLPSSGLMIPRKSITGFVLAAETIPLKLPCSFCKSPCQYSRAGQ